MVNIWLIMVMTTNGIWVCLKMMAKPLNPMVLLIIIPMKNGYFIGKINHIFRQTHVDPVFLAVENDDQNDQNLG